MAGVVNQQRAAVERAENLLLGKAGIQTVRKNLRGLERRRKVGCREFRGCGEIGADVLIGNQQRLPVAGPPTRPFSKFTIFETSSSGSEAVRTGRPL